MSEGNNKLVLIKKFLKYFGELLISKKVQLIEKCGNIKNKIGNFCKTIFLKMKNKYIRRRDLKKQKYDSLAPRDDIKESATVDMLRKALKEKKNKNVALSGKYGAGKSSIVLSALKNQRKFKPLYISLGMLGIQEKNIQNKDGEEENNIGKNIEIISRTIEKSIIQQIIYKEKSNKFPASRIKRIPYVNKLIIFFITFGIAFYKLEIVQKIIKDFVNIIIESCKKILLEFSNNQDNIKVIEFFGNNQYIDEFIKVVILGFIIYFLSKYIVSFIRKYSLKNIKVMFLEENEIEIENTEESLINKYMDELVYFFEMTDYNLIVIEDLDRFLENKKLKQKVIIIFQKLKELNQILNTSKQLHGRKITFLYVMRDDLFNNEEERTKFFDFIVPKIPEISTYNSYAKLRKVFDETEISNKFLQQLSTYIKDYRVIKNLKNEFDLYKREITGKGIVKEKLLGMIALKNLRPKEYEELIKEDGNLYEFIKNKKQLYQKQEDNLNEKIQNNKNLIIELEKDKIKTLEELKYLALGNLACLDAHTRGYGNVVDKTNFLSDSFDIETIENNTINIKNHDGYHFSEEQLFKCFGGKEEFVKRAKKVEKNTNDEIKRLKEESRKFENQIENLHKLNISELLKKQDNEEIEELDEFEIMMLKSGYIDENYKNYCFKFEETEEIKRNDFSYILNVRQDKKTNYDFNIEKPKNVITELDELFFEKKAIWNYKILDQLIPEKESKKLSKFIDTLIEIDDETYGFIIGYISFSKNKNKFLKLLYSRKKEIIYDIFNYGIQNGQDEDGLVELLLNIPELLTEQNLKNSLVEYIIERVGSDVWFELNENVKKSLKLLEIEFSEISDVENNIDLLEFIYENNLYELNEEMIKSIFIYLGFKATDFEQSALSLILKSNKLEKLNLYVSKNKEQFIKKCFVNTNGIGNNIDDLIDCINTWEVDYELKNILVSKIYGKIDDISKVKDITIYPSILENDKMEISWENVYKIYCATEELTEELIKYIEKNIKILETKKILFVVPENEKTKYISFRGKIARCNNIKLDIYKKLLGKLNIYINTIENDEIENQRIELLIKMKILKLNANTFNIIKNQKIDSLSEFVSLNIDDFIKYIDEIDLDSESLEKIILSDKIKNKYKTIILSKISAELLSISSIEYIIDNYKRTGISNISEEMKVYIFSSDINIESKIFLLNKELERNIEEGKIKEYISYLPEDFCKIGNTNFPQISISKTKLNEELLKRLETKLNISSSTKINKIVIFNKK